MNPIVTLDQRQLEKALEDGRFGLTSDQRKRITTHIMGLESTRTPRQDAEVKRLRATVKRDQARVQRAISLTDELAQVLDDVLSIPSNTDIEDDDE
jgi:N-acyl-D-aspartate/D-glutamate deacylase